MVRFRLKACQLPYLPGSRLFQGPTLPSSAGWYGVTYGNGKFVAVAYDSDKTAYSTDGINWTAATMPSSSGWYDITYGGE